MLTNEELAEAAKKYSLEGFLKRHSSAAKTISLAELESECRAFEKWEPRDSMYRVSTFLVREWWGDPAKLVDALSVLLLVWNGAFYRYGNFDEAALETNLRDNQAALNAFRERDIASFGEGDIPGKRIPQGSGRALIQYHYLDERHGRHALTAQPEVD